MIFAMRTGRLILSFVTLLAVAVGMAACGGSGNKAASETAPSAASQSQVVARAGNATITRAQVSHWMGALAGSDYFTLSHQHIAPAGLVSDPPNYARCVAQIEALAAQSPSHHAKETGVQLLARCRHMYEALRIQAMTLLVRNVWFIGVDSDEGVSATNSEVQSFFAQQKQKEYPTEEALHRYLTSRRLTLSDLMTEMKVTLLAQKELKKIEDGGAQARQKFTESEKRWIAKISCQPGYIVKYCKQYKGETETASITPASVLMEQLAAIATGFCANRPACAAEAEASYMRPWASAAS